MDTGCWVSPRFAFPAFLDLKKRTKANLFEEPEHSIAWWYSVDSPSHSLKTNFGLGKRMKRVNSPLIVGNPSFCSSEFLLAFAAPRWPYLASSQTAQMYDARWSCPTGIEPQRVRLHFPSPWLDNARITWSQGGCQERYPIEEATVPTRNIQERSSFPHNSSHSWGHGAETHRLFSPWSSKTSS